jgi:hypothetical protein
MKLLRRRTAAKVGSALVVSAGLLVAPALTGTAQAAGHAKEFSARVIRGVQIYECRTNTDGSTAFAFKQPRAKLQRGIKHDVGPVWLAPDGSGVRGTVVTSTPRPGTIAELTLTATSIGGPGLLSPITTIKRLETSGGVAPAGACTLGAIVEVPYGATYVFIPTPPPAKTECEKGRRY